MTVTLGNPGVVVSKHAGARYGIECTLRYQNDTGINHLAAFFDSEIRLEPDTARIAQIGTPA